MPRPKTPAETSNPSSRPSPVRFLEVRAATVALCRTLAPEDVVVQSMPDTSPTKWHLAHTTWFFERFVLAAHDPAREDYDERWAYLFNSYYESAGPRHARPHRGLLSRPTLDEVMAYRRAIDDELAELLEAELLSDDVLFVVELGLHHEQQHQELILTDIKHVFWSNPLRPALFEQEAQGPAEAPGPLSFLDQEGGLVTLGADDAGFAFDNERPVHRAFLEDFALGNRLVTCREYLAFMEDGGYRRPELWLSAGWDAVKAHGWTGPLYWEERGGERQVFTLGGMRPLRLDTPVCHVSYFEADAYARWAGARLPSEQEWEVGARELPVEGNFASSEAYHPLPMTGAPGGLCQLYGDVWEWTQSTYGAYPGFVALQGSLGEYNGKFMHGQQVLRGGSCVTPAGHVRPTYRNFFYGPDRWQFTGIRLATGGEPSRGLSPRRRSELAVVDLAPERESMLRDVVEALEKSPRSLPTQYLYDERGSRLFDEICELDEYYLTRTELAILRDEGASIAKAVGPEVLVVEPGAGSSIKIRRLLQALSHPVGYVPVDISGEHLVAAAEDLKARFKDLEVLPVVADFTRAFELPQPSSRRPRRSVLFFPGSTIGNFTRKEAVRLLAEWRQMVGEGGAILIGVDLKKDRGLLEAAYNDSEGVSAAFSINLLRHINRALGADFVLEEWHHEAVWNEAESRIEIYLVSRQDQAVHVGTRTFRFEAGEPVRTEYSHKYAPDAFARLAGEAGLEVRRVWTDKSALFSVQLLEPAEG